MYRCVPSTTAPRLFDSRILKRWGFPSMVHPPVVEIASVNVRRSFGLGIMLTVRQIFRNEEFACILFFWIIL